VDRVVAAFHCSRPDYAGNVLERTYPRGLDTEVIGFSTLERAWREASEPYQRVHVTPYIYQHPELFRLLSVTAADPPPGEASRDRPMAEPAAPAGGPSSPAEQRWTVDTAEDLAFVSAVYSELDDHAGWEEVLALLERRPELLEINRQVRQKALHDG